jgi:hypothetical protein
MTHSMREVSGCLGLSADWRRGNVNDGTIASIAITLLSMISGGVFWIIIKVTRVETLLNAHLSDGRVHNYGPGKP